MSDTCLVRLRLLQVGIGAALAAALLLAGSAMQTASGAARFAPTPTSPIYRGIPGALPPNFRYVYNDRYQGWPINPTKAEHPVRGSFLDPRGKDDTGLSGYHFGIDVSIDDRHPEAGAPAGVLPPCLRGRVGDRGRERQHAQTGRASTGASTSGISPTGTSPRPSPTASTSRPGSRSAGPAKASGMSTSPNGRSSKGRASGSIRSTTVRSSPPTPTRSRRS